MYPFFILLLKNSIRAAWRKFAQSLGWEKDENLAAPAPAHVSTLPSTKNVSLEPEMNALFTRINTLETELAEHALVAKKREADLHAQMQALEQDKAALSSRLAEMTRSASHLEQERQRLVNLVDSLKAERLKMDAHTQKQPGAQKGDDSLLEAQLQRQTSMHQSRVAALEQELAGISATSKKQKDELQTQLMTVEREKTDLQSKLRTLARDKDEALSKLTFVEQEKSELTSRVGSLEDELSLMVSSSSRHDGDLHSQLVALEQEKVALASRLAESTRTVSGASASLSQLEQDKAALSGRLAALELAAEAANNKLRTVTLERDSASSRLVGLEAERHRLAAAAATASAAGSSSPSKDERARATALQVEVSELSSMTRKQKEELLALQSRVLAAERDKADLQAKLRALGRERDEGLSKVAFVEKEKAELVSRVSTLEGQLLALEGQFARLLVTSQGAGANPFTPIRVHARTPPPGM